MVETAATTHTGVTSEVSSPVALKQLNKPIQMILDLIMKEN